MTRKHFELIARVVKANTEANQQRRNLALAFADELRATNVNFNPRKFLAACGVEPSAFKTGDGKRHATRDAADIHAGDVFNRTGNIIAIVEV